MNSILLCSIPKARAYWDQNDIVRKKEFFCVNEIHDEGVRTDGYNVNDNRNDDVKENRIHGVLDIGPKGLQYPRKHSE